MKVQHFLTISATCFENLFSGLIFGWSFFALVLKDEGYYSHLCQNSSENINCTNVTSTTGEATVCAKQNEAFSLIFSIGIFVMSFSTFACGIIFRKFGSWITRSIAIVFPTCGYIIIATSSNASPDILFLGFGLATIGGMCYFASNFQFINLAPNFQSTLSAIYSGMFQCSSVLLWIVHLAHRNGISFRTILFGFTSMPLFSVLVTLFLTPIKFLPAEVGKNYTYGIHNCLKKHHDTTNGNTVVAEVVVNEATENELKDDIQTVSNSTHQNTEIDNVPSVWSCIKTRFLLTTAIQTWCLHFRNVFFIGSFNPWVASITNDPYKIRTLTDTFAIFLLAGGMTGIFVGMLLDKLIHHFKNNGDLPKIATLKSLLVGSVIDSTVGVIFALLVTIPNVNLQYFSLFVYGLYRGTIYSYALICIRNVFHFKLTAALFGFINAFNGVIALLTTPFLNWVFSSFDGNFLYVNIILLAICVLSYIHPLSIYFEYRKQLKSSNPDSFVLRNEYTNH